MSMTDEEYAAVLRALAAKHLRSPRSRGSVNPDVPWQKRVDEVYALARLVNAVAADPAPDRQLLELIGQKLKQVKPVRIAETALEDVGILSALEDAPLLVLGQFRRTAFPTEDIAFLRRAGFTDDEIEVLVQTVVLYNEQSALLSTSWSSDRETQIETKVVTPSQALQSGAIALDKAADELARGPEQPAKKRKLFNGIGKLLAGSVMGLGNALVATGAILSPNPAIGSVAIASGAAAVGSILAGIGDLRGE